MQKLKLKKTAFTLIELLVVITILAILAWAVIPFYQNYVQESRVSKARSDLEEIRKALVIYETREGVYKSSNLFQLVGRYIDNMPTDPWGKQYIVATDSGVVFSGGPDRIEYTVDDIRVDYLPPLALVSVKWVDANQSGDVDSYNNPDYLRLSFSRKIVATSPFMLDPSNAHQYFDWSSSSDITASLDWENLVLDQSNTLIIISLDKNTAKSFVPAHDLLWISDGSGIRDNANNHCLSSQTVLISGF